MSLISQSDLENRIGRALTNEEASAFTIINTANQTYIERMLNTDVESVSPSTRYYDGGVQNLEIDPCTEVTSVKLVDAEYEIISTLALNEYTVEPSSRILKTMVRNRYGKFITGMNVIGVSAKFSTFGDSDVTSIIKNALLDMASSTISNSAGIVKESIEGYTVEYGSAEQSIATKALNTIQQGII